MRCHSFVVFLMLFATSSYAQTKTVWKNDPDHSRLGFSVTHVLVNDITGRFDSFNATVTTSKADFSDAVFELTADASSVDTRVEKRDEDLRSDRFFGVQQFPTLHFQSTAISRVGKDRYKVRGNLTIHGITKAITVDFRYRGTIINPNSKKPTAGLQITATLKRSDYKLGLVLPFDDVKDDVLIKADGEFTK